jgi:hypothetical protein
VVPEPEHGRSEMQYFSVSPVLSLILACLNTTCAIIHLSLWKIQYIK